MKYIGKKFDYITSDGEKRFAVCKKIEFHQLLKKPIFIGVSPFGNEVKLSREEINKFYR